MKGRLEGFTNAIRERCADVCAEYGEPPCWKLPDLTRDCDNTTITPCAECRQEKAD